MRKIEVNYLQVFKKGLFCDEFKHLWYLVYWIFYGIAFYLLEKRTNVNFYTVHIPLDDYIPFCKWFMIPYMYWFVFLIGYIVFILFYDVEAFKKFMWFMMISITITLVIYVIFPTQQDLRPEIKGNDFISDFIRSFYKFDTSTNVCPSIHVISSMAVAFGMWDYKYTTKKLNFIFIFLALLISFSTVFVKQHSIVDVATGLLLSFIVYLIVYVRKNSRQGSLI